jgi:hypothetical protein
VRCDRAKDASRRFAGCLLHSQCVCMVGMILSTCSYCERNCTKLLILLTEKHGVFCQVGTECLCLIHSNVIPQVVPSRRRSVAGLSPRTAWFDSKSVHGGFVVGQVFIRVIWFPLVGIISQLLHTHLHLNTDVIRRTTRRCM